MQMCMQMLHAASVCVIYAPNASKLKLFDKGTVAALVFGQLCYVAAQ